MNGLSGFLRARRTSHPDQALLGVHQGGDRVTVSYQLSDCGQTYVKHGRIVGLVEAQRPCLRLQTAPGRYEDVHLDAITAVGAS